MGLIRPMRAKTKAQFCGAGGSGFSDAARPSHTLSRPRSATSSAPVGAPIDLVHLAKQTCGDEALEREVLSLFRSQSSLYVACLRRAKADDERRMAAHALRGCALSIGAWHVARLAKNLELNDQNEQNEQADSVLIDLAEAVDRACFYIKSLDDQPA
ncbi:MAG: Hpt domain-containing protein [Pseudomonadota bacterium]